MTYEIGKMKLDELAGYFRDGKINLIPPFQRGRVWTPALRKKLLENIVRGKPIPAIFLFYTRRNPAASIHTTSSTASRGSKAFYYLLVTKRPPCQVQPGKPISSSLT